MASVGSQSEVEEIEVLEDEDEPPTEEQVLEYAEFLGMDLESERHLLWIAREGVAAPVPKPWKTCKEKGEVFYFNFDTEESSWDHPLDGHYRNLLEEQRKKPRTEASSEVLVEEKAKEERKQSKGEDSKQEEDGDASFVSEMVGSDSEASSRKALNSGAAWSDSSARSASAHSAQSSEEGAAQMDLPKSNSQDKALHGAKHFAEAEHMVRVVHVEPEAEATPLQETKTLSPSKTRGAQGKGAAGVGLGSLKDSELPSSNISEVSEDFRSDWGAPSPLGSGAGGLSREAHSLEVSTSGDAGSLSGVALVPADKSQTNSPPAAAASAVAAGRTVKSWTSLNNDLACLREVLASAGRLREQQAALLSRLKS